jgi:hypothetical protein
MPIIGHIAQTGQIVATNFRTGNVSCREQDTLKEMMIVVPVLY